ncbi:MAG: homoserine dehydrogenase [Candidatus Omnitrophica bacterium]|nr:homoserine dehydrogenase [Candidatus Omnitrophota bacterium]
MRTLSIGILGCGQIGSAVISLLRRKGGALLRDSGTQFKIVGVTVRNPRKKRAVRIPSALLTTRGDSLVRDPRVNVIVELIGGTQAARKLVLEALRNGKDVVTANKALLAEHGDEIFELAQKRGRKVLFEASVGGGIPVIKALREGLIANRIDSIYSIINGTSNYILSEMSERNLDFKEALRLAQRKGYAEANPSLDIEGVDSAHKLAILVRLAFGGRVPFKEIYSEGISKIRNEDIAFAEEFGYRIKLLAIAKRDRDAIEARVQPTLLPRNHILANVSGSFNAILLRGDEVGEVLFYGKGAGPEPTASAVVSDLVDLAKGSFAPYCRDGRLSSPRRLKIKSISSILSRYYLRFHVLDKPGVLARISSVLGRHRVSISDVIQKERKLGGIVPLILLTHDAPENQLRMAIKEIDRLGIARGGSQVIRIEAEPK